jgi:LysR family transcriptional regulator, glycine cleavage system transcriptional activator
MPVRPPSLRAIAAFEAAARLGSFVKAAEELNLTQSAVSYAVRGLEERLGMTLFDRGKATVTLTQSGATLASRVRLSLSLLNEAFETQAPRERSRLVVSVLGAVAHHIVIPRLATFFAANDDIEIDLRPTRKLADLKSQEADVAIRFGQGQWPGLHAALLAKDVVCAVTSPQFRDGDLPKTPAELLDCDTIIHPAISWRLWLDAAGLSGEMPKGPLRTDDGALMMEAAAQGCGVALVHEKLARRDLTSGRLVKLFPIDAEDDYAHYAVWDNESPKLPMIQRFVDWLRLEFAALDTPNEINGARPLLESR